KNKTREFREKRSRPKGRVAAREGVNGGEMETTGDVFYDGEIVVMVEGGY
ncbi:hypothetical protein A2U01_0025590, partial [Trifolium medium]|nr:hypothetical protein [Trifolium medium]